jgi:DNA-binding transcriptional MerR regulator
MSWKVGEVARRAGLTVRTLHHWDAVGLVVPSERTQAGYRVYSDADVRRLYRVVALRGLGLSLDEVRRLIDSGGDGLADTIRIQLERLDAEAAAAARLRTRLVALLDRVETASGDDVMEVIEMTSQYYTPEQQAEIEKRRDALGEDGLAATQEAWADVAAALRALCDDGVDPADPRVQEQIARADELIDQFTGGNQGIREALGRMYQDSGPELASRGMFDAELFDYMKAARAVRYGG